MAGNIFRGAFGDILQRIHGEENNQYYARIFRPQSFDGPSGFVDQPRPFVLRPQGIEGGRFQPGDAFSLHVHLFDLEEKLLTCFVEVLQSFVREGLGPGRAPVELTGMQALTLQNEPSQSAAIPPPLQIDLSPPYEIVKHLRVLFRTPTELKSEGSICPIPHFPILFRRVRDRLSTLTSLYGQALAFDFKELGTRSGEVRLTDYQLQWESTQRRSSRTGQQHQLSGFVGWAEYEGDLGAFIPWLQAGYWSGVGRHTVWGKGEMMTVVLHS